MENYEIVGIIGKGNFGSISKIKRKSDNKTLVWKELDYGKMSEKEKQHIVSEVNILRDLKHPNIVRYYDRIIDKKNTKIYIIMEFCEGGDIGALIKRCKKNKEYIAEDVIWKIFTQIILALHECHTRKEGKILHRDLKPSNVFLDSENNVKLGDFGLSRVLSNESTFAYSHVGTPYYMSPEQIDEIRYNEKSDIWSLGCFLYEITSFNPPFEATNHLSLALKIKSGKVERIPSRYSEELWRVINWMLSIDQDKRPSIEDLLNLPQISLRLRERRLKDNMTKLKKFEDSLKSKENELTEIEKQLEIREKALKEREDTLKELEKKLNEKESRAEKFEKINKDKFLYSSGGFENSTGGKNYSTNFNSGVTSNEYSPNLQVRKNNSRENFFEEYQGNANVPSSNINGLNSQLNSYSNYQVSQNSSSNNLNNLNSGIPMGSINIPLQMPIHIPNTQITNHLIHNSNNLSNIQNFSQINNTQQTINNSISMNSFNQMNTLQPTIQASATNFYRVERDREIRDRINLDSIVNSPSNQELFSDRRGSNIDNSNTSINNNVMTSYKYNPEIMQTLQENSTNYSYLGNTGTSNKIEFNSSKASFKTPMTSNYFLSGDFTSQIQPHLAQQPQLQNNKENYNFKFDPSLYKDRDTINSNIPNTNINPHNVRVSPTLGGNHRSGSQERDLENFSNIHSIQKICNVQTPQNESQSHLMNKQKSSTNFSVNNLTMKGIRNTATSSQKSGTPNNHTHIRNFTSNGLTKQNTLNSVSSPMENFSTLSSTPQMSNRIGTSSSESKFIGNKYSSILTKDRSASPSVVINTSINNQNNSVRKSLKIPNK